MSVSLTLNHRYVCLPLKFHPRPHPPTWGDFGLDLNQPSSTDSTHITEKVDQLFLDPRGGQKEEVVFKGFQNQGKLTEFLFALPRNQRVTDGDEVAGTSRLSLLGSVQTRFFSAGSSMISTGPRTMM